MKIGYNNHKKNSAFTTVDTSIPKKHHLSSIELVARRNLQPTPECCESGRILIFLGSGIRIFKIGWIQIRIRQQFIFISLLLVENAYRFDVF